MTDAPYDEASGHWVLAVDHGTSGIKAALLSETGRVADSEFVPTETEFLDEGGAEQDPEGWWQGLVTASRRLVERGSVGSERIGAVCVSSTYSTTVAVDRQGDAVLPALTWMDSRGREQVRRAVGGFPSFRGYQLGRLRKWISRTAGAPSLSGKDDAAHVLWLRDEHPDLYARTEVFLPSKDYLNLRLTGECAASPDSVQLFWVTDTRNLDDVRYDDELIALLGIERDKLPSLRRPTERLGALRAEVADSLGLSRGTSVFTGSPDHQAALVGSGAVRDFEAHLYVGTSSWVQCPLPRKRTDVLHSIASFPAAIPGRYQSVNEQDFAGGALGFVVDNVLQRACALLDGRVPERPYERLDELAALSPAGSNGVLFTPWLNGERTPVDDPDLRGGWHNLAKTTTLEDLVRAVLEGVACNIRWSLTPVERFVRHRLDPIVFVGGGANSALWCQIIADVCDREIHQAEGPIHANARGAAFLAAIGAGWISFDDVPGLVPIAGRFLPDPANRRLYDDLFGTFRLLHRRLRPVYHRLNRARGAHGVRS